MPDIFISYKKEERAVAAQLATRLTEAGYDVWWDAALLAGERFEDEIATVLRSSRAVIILWSKRAVESDWVKAEAESARAQKKALPAVIDDVPMDNLPLLFRGLHVARLSGWNGESGHSGFDALMASVADRLGEAAGPHLSVPQAEAKLAENVGEAEVWSAIAGSADPSAAEYRSYLKRFGTSARFAELAEIRIARLEEREQGEKKISAAPKPGGSAARRWWPAIVLPLVALAIIGGGWFAIRGDMSRITDILVDQKIKDAADRCTKWSKSAVLEWRSTLPVLEDGITAACQDAETTWPRNGDYKGMLAMVRVAQGSEYADDGIALARKGIELNSALANYVTGVMYDYGLKLQSDFSRAASYYKTAYQLGYPDAAGRLCYMAENNGATLPYSATTDEIFQLCSSASEGGSAIGQAIMGYIYEYGDFGRTVDAVKASELYERAAAQGLPQAKVQLGAMLIRGNGIRRDPERAVTLFEEAAQLGYPEAMRWLGIFHELGVGVEKDMPRAGQLYDQANSRYDMISHFLLGYSPNQNDDRGDFTRRELNRLSADQSNSVGQRLLGVMQQYAVYTPQNFTQAFASMSKCRDTSVLCQLVLGAFHAFGPDQYYDMTLAIDLFLKAAAAGEMHAQYQMARFYEAGDSVPQDLEKAREMYQLALAQGYEIAQQDLDRLNQAGGSPKS